MLSGVRVDDTLKSLPSNLLVLGRLQVTDLAGAPMPPPYEIEVVDEELLEAEDTPGTETGEEAGGETDDT